MRIEVSGLAWFNTSDLSEEMISWLKKDLTITQRISQEYAKRSRPAIVELWVDDTVNCRFGIPREYFFDKVTRKHDVEFKVSRGLPWPERLAPSIDADGNMPNWTPWISTDPTELTLVDTIKNQSVKLKPEQIDAMTATVAHLGSRPASGGLVQAPTGWGKSIFALALARQMKVRTAILVHREFLMNQWKKRIAQFLPDAKVGTIAGKKWDVEDKHIVLVMIETLASWAEHGKARPELSDMFGLVITDEVHRAGAPKWGMAVPLFNSAWRVGISAHPKRSDGLDKVFFYHMGPKVFTGTAISRIPKIRRVWSNYKINHPRVNSGMMSMEFCFKLMSADAVYNQDVINQIKLALEKKRKIIVYSHTVKHLNRLKEELDVQWKESKITTDYYIGGMTEAQREEAEKADCIFATFQMAKDSLDIPALDTVVLAGPVRNPTQPAGRACRDHPDKQDPIIVDMRADNVPVFREYGESRDRVYDKIYGAQTSTAQTTLPGTNKS